MISHNELMHSTALLVGGNASRFQGEDYRRWFMFADRWKYVSQFGFVALTPLTLQTVADHAPRSLVSVGAGTAALETALVHNHGLDIVPTDAEPVPAAPGPDHVYGFKQRHAIIQRFTGARAVREHPTRDVLMAWPTLSSRWPLAAAQAMVPGQRLLYIGEGQSGCTADDAFHNYLTRAFTPESEYEYISSWEGLHDHLQVWRKQ